MCNDIIGTASPTPASDPVTVAGDQTHFRMLLPLLPQMPLQQPVLVLQKAPVTPHAHFCWAKLHRLLQH